jgi:hypothetical protein
MPAAKRAKTSAPPPPPHKALVDEKHVPLGPSATLRKATLEECREAAPVLFAEPGDLFEHRLDERMQGYEYDCFEYLGRAKGIGTDEMWSMGDNDRSSRGVERTPKGWLVFKHDGCSGNGVDGSYGAVNGGMRDVINAWPVYQYYLYDAKGEPVDKDHILCLPPRMCYCFRKLESPEESDEEEGEGEGEDE